MSKTVGVGNEKQLKGIKKIRGGGGIANTSMGATKIYDQKRKAEVNANKKSLKNQTKALVPQRKNEGDILFFSNHV